MVSLLADGDLEGHLLAVDGEGNVLGARLDTLLDGQKAHLADPGVAALEQAVDRHVAAVGRGGAAVEEQHLRGADGEGLASLDGGVDAVVVGLPTHPLGGGGLLRRLRRRWRGLCVHRLLIGGGGARLGIGRRGGVVANRLRLGGARTASDGAEDEDDHVVPGDVAHR